MKQSNLERIAEKRRSIIKKLVSDGESFAEIGKIFNVSSVRARQIYMRAKDHDEKIEKAFGLGMRLYNILRSVLKTESPTLADFSAFIKKNPDWRDKLLSSPRIGPIILEEFERFARENGILR